MKLLEILNKYNSDKGTVGKYPHHYHEVYEKFFKPIRYEKLNILEVGIWIGASQSAWIEYFPNSHVYGIDIFSRIKPDQVPILSHKRMHYLECDSTSEDLVDKIHEKWGDIHFDIIIDDGKHTPMANALTFKNLIPLLSLNGSYYIEDAWPLHKMSEEEKKHRWIVRNPDDYNTNKMNFFLDTIGGYTVEEFDLRNKSKAKDSYIFRITK